MVHIRSGNGITGLRLLWRHKRHTDEKRALFLLLQYKKTFYADKEVRIQLWSEQISQLWCSAVLETSRQVYNNYVRFLTHASGYNRELCYIVALASRRGQRPCPTSCKTPKGLYVNKTTHKSEMIFPKLYTPYVGCMSTYKT